MAYTQAALISTGVIFPAIGFALVCLRFWMRVAFQKTFVGVDDWLILAASILVIGMAVDAILGKCSPGAALSTRLSLTFSSILHWHPGYGWNARHRVA